MNWQLGGEGGVDVPFIPTSETGGPQGSVSRPAPSVHCAATHTQSTYGDRAQTASRVSHLCGRTDRQCCARHRWWCAGVYLLFTVNSSAGWRPYE